MNKLKNNKYVLSKTAKYKVPCLITLSGLPGSGKTVCAKVLSKNLKVFILSNDFIRKIYINNETENVDEKIRQRQNRLVLLLNTKRLLDLLTKRISIVLDSDLNNVDKFKKIELLSKIFNYQIIKIKINTDNDYINLSRIRNRDDKIMSDIDQVIIGDNMKGFCYSENAYYKIKQRKPQVLDDDFFDYVLDNNSDLEKYINEINDISEEIISKKLVLK